MKVKCQASCSKCYHEKGRTQEFDSNDLIWFCTSCKQNLLCDIGIARGYDHAGKVMYSCNICGRPLIKEEVDKSIIAKNQSQVGAQRREIFIINLWRKKEKRRKDGWENHQGKLR